MELRGAALALAPHCAATTDAEGGVPSTSGRLRRGIERFNNLIGPLVVAASNNTSRQSLQVLNGIDVHVANLSEPLTSNTDYSYTLRITAGKDRAAVMSPSIYGALYALESLTQLIESGQGVLPATSIDIADSPDYRWRGLLVDTGRRFAPVWLLRNIIDTMAATKLNVLHLHATDFCRFGVESKRFPKLTADLGPGTPNEGFYSQDDIKGLVAYAGDRGVRLVPEFEVPAHALGLLPIVSADGLQFCSTCAYGKTGNGSGMTCKPSQLWGTPGTVQVLSELLAEMSALFTDEVFHIGADETFVKSSQDERCTANTTAFLEAKIVATVASIFGKTPAGWEQVLFETGAATNETIVYAYISGASKVTATGHKTVVANGSSLYFTLPAPQGPLGWHTLWYDIGFDVPSSQRDLLLGGEMSMWTDTYCDPRECGAMPAYHKEKGGVLYNRSHDVPYGQSLGGMIWPRGFVGAAAFWHWNASIDSSSDSFVDNVWALNDALAARGALVCPSNCSCDQLTACGRPYIG